MTIRIGTIRIGIDVGGTNTDAVVMRGPDILAAIKSPTTEDITTGVLNALNEVRRLADTPEAVSAVMIGTTHFTNAVVQRRDLAQTAVVRLGLPATRALPPLSDWPDDLKAAIGDHVFMALT